MSLAERNREIEKKNQNELRDLEQFYTQGKIDNMLENINQRKKELVDDMIKYANSHNKPCKWNRDGEPTEWEIKINPLVISNYFFKSIVPISSQEPVYNAEKLSMIFDYYCEILSEVNDKIGNFPSSLTLFCKFAGITSNTLRRWKSSDDYCMRTIVEKIYDQVGDENITMAQMGIVKETSTLFKMKSQNEMVEKAKPNVNISAKIVDVDIDDINDKINNYKLLVDKKGKN